MLVPEFFGIRVFVKLLKGPKHLLLPILFVLCVVGAFGLSDRMFDVWASLLYCAWTVYKEQQKAELPCSAFV